jgi:hypothetical protein
MEWVYRICCRRDDRAGSYSEIGSGDGRCFIVVVAGCAGLSFGLVSVSHYTVEPYVRIMEKEQIGIDGAQAKRCKVGTTVRRDPYSHDTSSSNSSTPS